MSFTRWTIIVHDVNDRTYVGRLATQIIERAADVSPVVVIMGARQTGKSTLVRSEPFLSEWLADGVLAVPWHQVV